jgi:hypothetical protein
MSKRSKHKRAKKPHVHSSIDNQPKPQAAETEQSAQATSMTRDFRMNNSKRDDKQANNENIEQKFLERLKNDFRNPRFLVEILALIRLALYVCETRRTNNLTQAALNNSQRNFESDQAPVNSDIPATANHRIRTTTQMGHQVRQLWPIPRTRGAHLWTSC